MGTKKKSPKPVRTDAVGQVVMKPGHVSGKVTFDSEYEASRELDAVSPVRTRLVQTVDDAQRRVRAGVEMEIPAGEIMNLVNDLVVAVRRESKTTTDKLTSEKQSAYHERDKCVALIARLAMHAGFRVGLGRHSASDRTWEADWRTIVFIDLPSGQTSWHIHDSEVAFFAGIPAYDGEWDGHTTPEKYDRVLDPQLPKKS